MSNASIKSFMRSKARQEEVVSVLAPEGFVDEKGERAVLKVKRLSTNHINKVYEQYNYSTIARDENKQPIVRNNRIVKDFVQYAEGNINRLIVDALVFPDLHDKELMEFYGCVDVMDMPHAVFASRSEYEYVRDVVMKLSGTLSGEECDCIINEAKN